MGNNKNKRIEFNCYHCNKIGSDKPSHYKRKQKHFCSIECYSLWRKSAPPEMQNRWTGGVSNTEAHRRWKKKNPERMAHLKSLRYAREKNAIGSHTLDEWNLLKAKCKNKCACCLEEKPLTKDHIIPLSLGGTNYINNIQPLCRNCNSKKNTKIHIYENPELLEAK